MNTSIQGRKRKMNLLVTVEEKRKKTIGRRLKAVKSLKKFRPQSVYKTRMLE